MQYRKGHGIMASMIPPQLEKEIRQLQREIRKMVVAYSRVLAVLRIRFYVVGLYIRF
jgi:hypothetical protein